MEQIFTFLVCVGLCSIAEAGERPSIDGQVTVVDGDSIMVDAVEVRLHGVDAPEGRDRCFVSGRTVKCGAMALAELEKIAGGKNVTCKQVDTDRYKRAVAICETGNKDIGEALVRSGWALAYRKYSTRYVSAENEAKAAGRGLWGR